MRKIYLCKVLLSIYLLTGILTANAQEKLVTKQSINNQKVNNQQQQNASQHCYTHERMLEFFKTHPNALTLEKFEEILQQKIVERKKINGKVLDKDYVIPIVFHVIHNGENMGTGSNIEDKFISEQVEQLNIDFANLAVTTWINPNVAANTQLQFCLAKVNPNGDLMPTPGIERINRNDKGFNAPPYASTYIDNVIKPATIWDPEKYFNVWVMELSNGLLGYATFPGFSTLQGLNNSETDTDAGVVILSGSVGSVNLPGSKAPYNLGRTLTHEAGHFFGLRHIWGDGNCATDYCDDTPTQAAATAGCPPLNPRPTSCNNNGNMFENYMDYSNDACLNTFTANQKERMQTVMENSPRRIALATSQVCSDIAANSIAFTTSTTNVTETGNVGTCPKYKEFNLTLNIVGAATGNATVTFTGLNGTTASLGKDYTITPAFVTYINGDVTDKIIVVRIYDDALVEGNEVINLGYSITGNGVVSGVVNQVNKITITDDDVTPAISQLPVTIFNENFGTPNNPSDLTGWDSGSFIDNPGINRWTVSANGGIDVQGLCAHITKDGNNNPNTYDFTSTSDVLLVTPLINASDYKTLTLSFRYKSNGEKAGNKYNDFGSIMYSLDGNTFATINQNNNTPIRFQGQAQMTNFSVNLPVELNNKSFYIGFRWSNNNQNGNNPGFTVDDIKVVAADARKVETQTGQDHITTVNTGDDIYFISPVDGDVIARVRNINENVGCVTAGLTSAGIGQVDVTTTGGIFKRSQKVWKITPSLANNTATYEGTLYFTKQEIDIWGGQQLGLKILKVKDGVDLNGVLGINEAQIVSPTNVTEYVDKGYITYTGNFTGFSQFMLVAPNVVLPVELVIFRARALSSSILLDWTTASEMNNKGFKVERSEDGNIFKEIGWVAGKGNSSQEQRYSFEDKDVQANVTYYYRLRQVDLDQAEKLSEIKLARISRNGLVVKVLPNPTQSVIKVQVSSPSPKADITLYNALGQALWRKSGLFANGQTFEIDLSSYASGVYTIEVATSQGKNITKVVKE